MNILLETLYDQADNLRTGKTVVYSKTASHLFQMCGHLFNDKCTKGRNHREGDIWEEPFHVLQCSPTPGLRWMQWGAAERRELGRRREKDLNFCSSQKTNGYLCSTYTTDLLWRLRTLWEINVKKWSSTLASFFNCLQRLYETLDIKWLNRNIPEHLQNRGGRSKVFPKKVLEAMLGTDFQCCSTPKSFLFTDPWSLKCSLGTSLVAQWLRFCAPRAGGPGSIPSRGTRSHMHAATKSLHAATKEPASRN